MRIQPRKSNEHTVQAAMRGPSISHASGSNRPGRTDALLFIRLVALAPLAPPLWCGRVTVAPAVIRIGNRVPSTTDAATGR